LNFYKNSEEAKSGTNNTKSRIIEGRVCEVHSGDSLSIEYQKGQANDLQTIRVFLSSVKAPTSNI
jgi:hypothetical protein